VKEEIERGLGEEGRERRNEGTQLQGIVCTQDFSQNAYVFFSFSQIQFHSTAHARVEAAKKKMLGDPKFH